MVVLSLVDTAQTKLPAMELLPGAQVGKFPVAARSPWGRKSLIFSGSGLSPVCGGQAGLWRPKPGWPGVAPQYVLIAAPQGLAQVVNAMR